LQARSTEPAELRRATRVATETFFAEARRVQPELADKLEAPLLAFVDDAHGSTVSSPGL
jgi:hypothetical protein